MSIANFKSRSFQVVRKVSDPSNHKGILNGTHQERRNFTLFFRRNVKVDSCKIVDKINTETIKTVKFKCKCLNLLALMITIVLGNVVLNVIWMTVKKEFACPFSWNHNLLRNFKPQQVTPVMLKITVIFLVVRRAIRLIRYNPRGLV